MPTEAKLGLVLGIGLTIALAVFYQPKDTARVAQPTAVNSSSTELQGQTTSLRN